MDLTACLPHSLRLRPVPGDDSDSHGHPDVCHAQLTAACLASLPAPDSPCAAALKRLAADPALFELDPHATPEDPGNSQLFIIICGPSLVSANLTAVVSSSCSPLLGLTAVLRVQEAVVSSCCSSLVSPSAALHLHEAVVGACFAFSVSPSAALHVEKAVVSSSSSSLVSLVQSHSYCQLTPFSLGKSFMSTNCLQLHLPW